MIIALSLGAVAGCIEPAAEDSQLDQTTQEITNPNPMLYPANAHPFFLSQTTWSELLWSYIYSQPIDHNPFLDTTGTDCGHGQVGPVWFLPAVPGSTLGTSVTRTCTIPKHRAILLQLASAMNDFPCPDPAFKPAPGQSLYDFLITAIAPLIDAEPAEAFEAALDGVAIHDPLQYRRQSNHVFLFKGNTSLNPGFDSCVTGHIQEAVSDGFYLMFQPMTPGHHTILVNGHDMHGVPVTLTEELTIQ
ncbi:MAG: hypothetical protein ABI678_20360 [Kofleriaceae bacterium]